MARLDGEIRERPVYQSVRIDIYRRYTGFRVECFTCGNISENLYDNLNKARKAGNRHVHQHMATPVGVESPTDDEAWDCQP